MVPAVRMVLVVPAPLLLFPPLHYLDHRSLLLHYLRPPTLPTTYYLHCLLPITQHPVGGAQCPVPRNYYIHRITYYSLPTSQSTTHHLLPAAYYSQLPPIIHYPLPATDYLLPRTYYLLLATYYLQSDEQPSTNLLVVGQ